MSDQQTVEAPTNAPTPVLTGSWFPTPDDETTLPLAGGHSMTIVTELPAGDTIELTNGLNLDADTFNASFEIFKLRNLAAHLVSWTLPLPVPDKPDAKLALVEKLGADPFARVYAALSAWTEAHRQGDIPIVPIPTLSAFDSWFTGGEETWTLDLPGGEWMKVRAEIAAGARAKLMAEAGRYRGMRQVAAYLLDWSFTHPNGRKVEPHFDSLKAMKTSRFGILYRTIVAYEQALQAREANPIGSGGSINPSALVN